MLELDEERLRQDLLKVCDDELFGAPWGLYVISLSDIETADTDDLIRFAEEYHLDLEDYIDTDM